MKEASIGTIKPFFQSYVIWAAIAMLLFDLFVRVTIAYWPIDNYNSPGRSWVWWAVRDFRQQGRPDMVLMGSSLMMAALHGGDATYLNTPQNVAFHHKCQILEDLLAQRTGARPKTFAFALGGQMASDAYALTSTLLAGDHQPRVIVYGIAPRDFMDNTLTSPAGTETFRYMTRLGGLEDVAWQARTTFWEQVEYLLGKVSAVYAHRLDFVYLQNHYMKQILKHTAGFKNLDEVHTPFPIRKQALLELPEDQGPNDLMIMPFNKAGSKFEDNLPEYRMRYRSFKPKLFEMQLSFLERMLECCKQRGIVVYLVNMPLTTDNIDLMPAGFYDNYMSRIGELARTHGSRVLDLNDPNLFGKECFADSVHMNGRGGVRFFEVLAERIAGNGLSASRGQVQ